MKEKKIKMKMTIDLKKRRKCERKDRMEREVTRRGREGGPPSPRAYMEMVD